MDEMSRLLDALVSGGAPLSISIREAFESVDPVNFTSYPLDSFWKDHPVPFIESEGGGVKTISAPHMLVELLHHADECVAFPSCARRGARIAIGALLVRRAEEHRLRICPVHPIAAGVEVVKRLAVALRLSALVALVITSVP